MLWERRAIRRIGRCAGNILALTERKPIPIARHIENGRVYELDNGNIFQVKETAEDHVSSLSSRHGRAGPDRHAMPGDTNLIDQYLVAPPILDHDDENVKKLGDSGGLVNDPSRGRLPISQAGQTTEYFSHQRIVEETRKRLTQSSPKYGVGTRANFPSSKEAK